MRFFTITTLLILLIAPWAIAQDNSKTPPPPCSGPEYRQFDFWLGEWDAVWSDTGKGHNTVTQELGLCVIEENFSTDGDSPFIGRSLSMYDSRTDQWRQTWVDNTGAYLDFEGGQVADSMILSREAVDKAGKTSYQRMVWYNIETDAFDWSWQKSTDGGTVWQEQWGIQYTRK